MARTRVVAVFMLALLTPSWVYNIQVSANPTNPTCPQPMCVCTLSKAAHEQPDKQLAVCTQIPTQQISTTISSLSVVNGFVEKVSKKMTGMLGEDLRALDLSSCQIQSIEAGSFDLLTQLTSFKLSNNNLRTIDASLFKKNTMLTELHLDGNKLRHLESALLTKLDRLRELHLQHNLLREIPVKMPLRLSYLNISHNNIAHITDLQQIQLKDLDLCGNPLEELSEQTLRSISHIQHLCLGGRAVALPSAAAALLKHLSQLELIAAPDNNAVLSAANQQQLQHIASLTALTIENYQMSSLGFLRNLTRLTTITVENVAVGTIDITDLLNSKPYLTHIDLANSPQLSQQLVNNMHLVTPLHSLQQVDLHNAFVTHLQPFVLPNKHFRVDLSLNPLHCDCDLVWLRGHHTLLINPDQTACATPTTHQGKLVVDVMDSIHCPSPRDVQTNRATDLTSPHRPSSDEHAVVYIALGCLLLVLVVIGLVLGLVYCQFKRRGINKVQPTNQEPTFQQLNKETEDTTLIKDKQ